MKYYIIAIIAALTLASCSDREKDITEDPDQLNKLPVPVAVAIELRWSLTIMGIALLVSKVRLGDKKIKHKHYHAAKEDEK